jgi:hypothetical protein
VERPQKSENGGEALMNDASGSLMHFAASRIALRNLSAPQHPFDPDRA